MNRAQRLQYVLIASLLLSLVGDLACRATENPKLNRNRNPHMVARACIDAGQYDSALKIYEEILSSASSSYDDRVCALFGEGNALRRKNDLPEALSRYDAALALARKVKFDKPDVLEGIFVGRAKCFDRLKKFEDAAVSYKCGLDYAMSPYRKIEVYQDLATAHTRLKRYAEAIDDLTNSLNNAKAATGAGKALTVKWRYPSILYQMASVYSAWGKTSDADRAKREADRLTSEM